MSVVSTASVMEVFRDEAAAFTRALAALPAPAWTRPTRCHPWLVRDVTGHVITVLARVPDMVAAPAPDRADTTATGYYRADERFSETANADRVRAAQSRAAQSGTRHSGAAQSPGEASGAARSRSEPSGAARSGGEQPRAVASLADDLAATARTVLAVCRAEPAGRIVRTRHGDAMLLADFLTTRVVELAVHGLDVADAVGRRPWLTAAAADHLRDLLFGPDRRAAVAALGWDPVTVLRKATGRDPVSGPERTALARAGLRALTLG